METHRSPQDTLHSALLAANATLLWANLHATREQAAAEAHARDMNYWTRYVREQYPHITGMFNVEDAALALKAFDDQETAAQARRDAGWHLNWRPKLWPRLLGAVVLTPVLMFIWWFAQGMIGAEAWRDDNTIPENIAATWPASQPWGWIITGVLVFLLVRLVTGAFIARQSNYHPQDDSIICRLAYPGRRLKTRSGETFTIHPQGLPIYEPKRLRFLVTATTGKQYSSDDILWDDQALSLMRRSIG